MERLTSTKGKEAVSSADLYRYILENRLVLGRAMGTLSDEEDDRILERMGDLWWDLSDEEQEAARVRAGIWASDPIVHIQIGEKGK